MIRAGGLTLNPHFIASMEWDTYSYANSMGRTTLIITMHDGIRHRIEHDYRKGWGGVDAYQVEKDVMAALRAQEPGK